MRGWLWITSKTGWTWRVLSLLFGMVAAQQQRRKFCRGRWGLLRALWEAADPPPWTFTPPNAGNGPLFTPHTHCLSPSTQTGGSRALRAGPPDWGTASSRKLWDWTLEDPCSPCLNKSFTPPQFIALILLDHPVFECFFLNEIIVRHVFRSISIWLQRLTAVSVIHCSLVFTLILGHTPT